MRYSFQAYNFSSAPIGKALIEAQKRGVSILVLLDKSNVGTKFCALDFFQNEKIPVLVDDAVSKAHNKIMIIDRNTLITGSFNFTKSAEEKNAENLLVIKNDDSLLQKYLENFDKRKKLSSEYE